MGFGGQRAQKWCERLFDEISAKLILYGRALGLSHGEAEDVLQDLFLALLKRGEAPEKPDHYCVRAYRNLALNYKRSLWRRLTRELEARPAGLRPLEREALGAASDRGRKRRRLHLDCGTRRHGCRHCAA